MKKWFLVFVFFVSSVVAADLKSVAETAKPMIAAINASAGMRFGDPILIPNYGVSYVSSKCEKFSDQWQKDWQGIKGMVAALGQTVKGFEPNELFSLHITYDCDFTNGDTQVTAQVKAGTISRLETWEIWVNGKKQQF